MYFSNAHTNSSLTHEACLFLVLLHPPVTAVYTILQCVSELGTVPACVVNHPCAALVINDSCLKQGLNVVIVSMDDKFLADTFALVSAKFPGQEFRKVGATFSPGVDYMDKIK